MSSAVSSGTEEDDANKAPSRGSKSNTPDIYRSDFTFVIPGLRNKNCACIEDALEALFSREYSQYWEKSLVQLILTTMAMGCGTSIFVDVSVAQLAKASMIKLGNANWCGPGFDPRV